MSAFATEGRFGEITPKRGVSMPRVGERVFVAVDVGDAVRREVTRVVSVLTGKLEAVKTPPKVVWVKPAALHVTIRFIGEVEPAEVERLQAAAGAADCGRPVRARLARHRHVPGSEASARAVARRHRQARRRSPRSKPKCRGASPASMRSSSMTRAFLPHLTLGRVKMAGAGVDWPKILQAVEVKRRHVDGRSRHALSQRIVAAGPALYWSGQRSADGAQRT